MILMFCWSCTFQITVQSSFCSIFSVNFAFALFSLIVVFSVRVGLKPWNPGNVKHAWLLSLVFQRFTVLIFKFVLRIRGRLKYGPRPISENVDMYSNYEDFFVLWLLKLKNETILPLLS